MHNKPYSWDSVTNEQLRLIRKALGLTQKELADRLRINKITISRYERGVQPIPEVFALAVKQLLTELS